MTEYILDAGQRLVLRTPAGLVTVQLGRPTRRGRGVIALAIDAPRCVAIDRAEVRARKRKGVGR